MKNYFIKNEKVYLLKDKREIAISKAMKIININKNIDSNEINAKIKYKSIDGYDEIIVGREVYLNKNNLIKLQSKGLGVNHENVVDLVKYFEECEDNVEVKYVHENLGFKNYNNTIIYRLDTAIGIESQYVGKYNVTRAGSIENI